MRQFPKRYHVPAVNSQLQIDLPDNKYSVIQITYAISERTYLIYYIPLQKHNIYKLQFFQVFPIK